MIRQILHQLETSKERGDTPWRELCGLVPYSTVMRWRRRQRQKLPVWQRPGPKKSQWPDWSELYPLLCRLKHGRLRSAGTGALYRRLSRFVSRRELAGLVQDQRRDHLHSMKLIRWIHPGLAWSFDATVYGEEGTILIPVLDLASRYRFQPLVTDRLDGLQIARHLENLFHLHGAPLFLKRDNGSPFNNRHVNAVLERFGVLPLNNPPFFPRYNGAMEKGIRDLKTALDRRLALPAIVSGLLVHTVEVTVNELNHSPRRCLENRTACAVYHDDALRLRWNRHKRKAIFRLLLTQFAATMGNTTTDDHPVPAKVWRTTVESWLRCQGLITVRIRKPKQKVSATSSTFWSHN